ncbi:WD repeat-containing protein 25 isoform X2 [Chanodichthys erythropterus]|uniref:WD repeat-containing protein 25 isoform X2 n=1 Tax=Chanodichthys erythropterus TaxID=933992 RepID=UPI00351E0912
MASLVDYEDSDSDPDQERLSAAPQPHLELYNAGALIMSSSSSSSSSSAQSTSGCMKRAQLQPAAVRPYIPKRQRVSTAAVQTPETQDTRPSAGAHLLSEVSERVRPFLGRKHGRAELPRRLQCCVQAHQGPVNTLQWSPVDHLSHLLLSASMDKTCKVWDGVGGGRCLQTYSAHLGAVRDACWLPCGRRLLSGSFDGTAALTDVETGQTVSRMENGFKVTCVAPRPSDPDVFLSGGFSSEVKAWDARCCKVLRVYKAAVQQTLDVLFLSGGREFVSSTDAVSRDSAERTLIAWDFETTAKLSNQIFHVEGFAVHCGFSADGSVLVSGSSTGSVHFYDYQSSQSLKTLDAHEHACVCAALHPVIPAVTATCDWTGEIKIWT